MPALAFLWFLGMVAATGAVGLAVVLAKVVFGDPMYASVVLMGMIGLSMIVGAIFVDWANGPPKPPWR